MKARDFHPRHLDIGLFAEQAATLEGDEPLTQFERLVTCLHEGSQGSTTEAVHWHAEGEVRRAEGGRKEIWLHLHAQVAAPLECQRCLEAVAEPLEVDRSFLFAATEEQAAQWDGEHEEDVLVISHHFNLFALIEDELLMEVPLVPRHEICPVPVVLSTGDIDTPADGAAPEREHPFAALAALKKTKSSA